ncbi:MAG: hypothetical protein ABFD89_11500 [Bryobacteraceae bacterium]
MTTKLNMTQAARRVGVSRQTFYRHIEKKGISTSQGADGNPVVDVSELLRVYGELLGHDDKRNAPTRQHATRSNDRSDTALQVEVDTLRREKVEALQARFDEVAAERDEWREQAQRLARLLVDQRETPPAPAPVEASDTPSPSEMVEVEAVAGTHKPAGGLLTALRSLIRRKA